MGWVARRRREFVAWARLNWPSLIVLAAFVAALAVVYYSFGARLGDVRRGVCALRHERKNSVAELKRAVRRSEDYLRKHPTGAPQLGISRQDIETNIRAQRANIALQEQTVRALAVVRCAE